MSETLKPTAPTAIRITRPYATEDEFLEHELDMLTRTTVTLVGAQSRAQGVVLRFELVLASGHVVLRGEGRVLAFKPDAHRGACGLTLRFTRLDTRSKSLVDRAAALRDQRRPSGVPALPPLPRGASMPDADVPVHVTLTPIAPLVALTPIPPLVALTPIPPLVPTIPMPSEVLSVPPPQASGPSPAAPTITVPAAPHRDELLDRLRARAKVLDPADVARILAAKRRHA